MPRGSQARCRHAIFFAYALVGAAPARVVRGCMNRPTEKSEVGRFRGIRYAHILRAESIVPIPLLAIQMQIESDHPAAAKLRLFALNSLKPTAADHVEAHVEQCAPCAEALVRVQAEHSSIRTDLRSKGLSAHVTAAGPVSVWVVENGSRWCIRLIGPMVHKGDS